MHFKINLTLISLVLIVIFFSIPFYNNWLNTNLFNPSYSIASLSKQLSVEQRMTNRFGYSYVVYKEMSQIFDKQKVVNPLVLLPPQDYLKENRIQDINVVEPAIFYYLTGRKAVWYDSPDVGKADFALVPDPSNSRVMLKRLATPQEREELLTIYKKYKLNL